MNKPLLFSSTLAVALSFVMLVPAAQAITMEQHQSFSSETTSDCEGSCSTTSSVSGSQHQFMSDDGSTPSLGRKSSRRHQATRDGKVTVAWSYRGGTCQIRYTEAGVRNYRYSTNTACDNGELEIGGLVVGKAYRFQVKQDNGSWSRTITRTAR